MLCSLIVALVLAPLRAEASVTLSERARPMSEVVGAIAKLTSSKLATSGPIGTDTVVLNVTDAKLPDLMSKLAEVSKGKWVETEGTEFLQRDEVMWRAWRAQEHAELVKEIATSMKLGRQKGGGLVPFDASVAAKMLKELDNVRQHMGAGQNGDRATEKAGKPEDLQQQAFDFSVFEQMSPKNRAIDRLLDALGPEAIAQAYEKGKVVYSTNPGRMQVPIGEQAGSILQDLNEESLAWAKATKEYRNEHPIDTGRAQGTFGDWSLDSSISKGAYSQFEKGATAGGLVVVFTRIAGSLSAEATLLTSSGAPFEPSSWGAGNPIINWPDWKATPISTSSTTLIVLDAEAMALKPAEEGPWSRPEATRISAELRQKLLRPTQFDPLSWGPAQALLGLSRSEAKQLVADLPDAEINESFTSGGNQTTPKALAAALADDQDLDVKSVGEWVTVAPRLPSEMDSHVDRALLEQCLAALSAKPDSAVDPIASFAYRSGDEQCDVLASYVGYTFPTIYGLNGQVESEPWPCLRIYATLSGEQLQALRQGAAIPLRDLTPEQRSMLTEWFYSDSLGGTESWSWDLETETSPETPLAGEPTILFPNGMPEGAAFSVRDISLAAIYPKASAEDGDQLWTIKQFGTTMTGSATGAIPIPVPTTCAYGNSRALLFKLIVGKGQSVSGGFRIFEPTSANFIPFKDIPAAVQTAIADGRKKIAKQIADGGNGQYHYILHGGGQ